MKIIRVLLATLFAWAPLTVFAQTDLGGFEIREFASDITIGKHAVVRVEEVIDIRFYEQRHGIFRTIPVEYRNASGNSVSIKIFVRDVKANGADVPYVTSRSGDDLVIKIGDPDEYVKGNVRYVIAYDVERALLHEDVTDELYWNVTGTEWAVIPKKSSARVRVEGDAPTSALEAACYTGAYGSEASACERSVSADGSMLVADFAAHDFLTVAFRFPKGFVDRPTTLERIWWFVTDNKVAGLPILIFFLLFGYWWREGRDPKPRAIVTEFSAPENLSPAEIGVLHDGKVHDRELSATIVDLAVRGYLKIIEQEEKGIFGASRNFIIERTEKPIDDLQVHEELLLEAVMGTAKRRVLNEMESRAKEVKAKRDEAERVLYDRMAARKWFVRNPQTIRSVFYGVAIALVIAAFWIVASLSTAWMVSLVVTAMVIAAFGAVMPKRTESGTRLYEQVLGFQEYLSKAEKYRLQWQEKEHVFEKLLPYAMVFMVVDKWTNALASTIRQPDWYQSSRPGVWDVYVFNSAMTDLNRSLNSAVMVSPKSAASGGSGIGGGFSGGGFGGGGGGSW